MITKMRLGSKSLTGLLGVAAVAASPMLLPMVARAQANTTITGAGRVYGLLPGAPGGSAKDYDGRSAASRRKISRSITARTWCRSRTARGRQAPAGFKVERYAQGFTEPRLIRTAPNGDLFLADSKGDKIWVMRGVGPDGKAAQKEVYATLSDPNGKSLPFGINFYPAKNPKWIYVANTANVVRFKYKAGDLHASGEPEVVIKELPGFAQLRGGGHWTRDVVFSPDGKRMFISVGSGSNVDDVDNNPKEFHRADVLEYSPEGKFVKVYA